MPVYEVHHSYPLEAKQKIHFAEKITSLHSHAFTTPSMFVNVTYKSDDASSHNYFVGGKVKETSTNRIVAMVRQGPSRKKEDFDRLAEAIESAWYDVVTGEIIQEGEGDKSKKGKDIGTRQGAEEETSSQKDAKKLLVVAFYPMLAARENGIVIPGAGEEGNWLKSNMETFHHRAEGQGDQDFVDLLEEVEKRQDLKNLVA